MRASSETSRAFALSAQDAPQRPARFLPAPASRWNRQRARRREQRAVQRTRIARCRSAWRGKIFELQTMANLRIAAQRSGAAARHIGQRKIEDAIFFERGCVGQAAFDAIAVAGKALAAIGRAAARSIRRQRCAPAGLRSARMSVFPPGAAQESRIFSRSGRGLRLARRQSRHQLRAFVLKANAALAKRRRRGHISGDNCARRGQQFAGFKLNAGLGEFLFATSASGECGRSAPAGLCPWRQIARAASSP